MRAVKSQSAARGESMKTLLARAIEAELGLEVSESTERPRVSLPLFGRATGPLANPTSQDLERMLSDDDALREATVATSAARRARSNDDRRK